MKIEEVIQYLIFHIRYLNKSNQPSVERGIRNTYGNYPRGFFTNNPKCFWPDKSKSLSRQIFSHEFASLGILINQTARLAKTEAREKKGRNRAQKLCIEVIGRAFCGVLFVCEGRLSGKCPFQLGDRG
jgi:hypothetical protein